MAARRKAGSRSKPVGDCDFDNPRRRDVALFAKRILGLYFVVALLCVPVRAGTWNAFGPKPYTRSTGAPVTVTDTFTVLNPSTQFTLQIVNNGVSSAVISINGVQVVGPSDFNQNVASIQKPITLQSSNQVSVQLRSAPGSSITATIVGVDNDPPTIKATVTPMPNGAGWNNSNVTVTFTCSDKTSGVASCAAPQTVTTERANQTIVGTAVDLAGNTASTSVTVNLDKTPPNLAITSPPNGQTISLGTASITVIGSQSDGLSGIAGVTCNGAAATISGSKFACTVSLTQGSNSISVQANDVAGNSTSSPLTLLFAPAPQVTITSPANLSVTNLTPVTVTGTVSDPNATLKINGISVPQSSGSFSIPVPLVEGLNVLTAVATNTSGVTGTATAQITLDTTPPHITIDSPADGTTTTDASVTVTGIANDVVVGTVNAFDVQVTVNRVTAQVANRTYSAPNVALSIGKNTIQAKGVDRAGNGTTASVIVTRVLPSQPPAPEIGKAVITQSLSIISGNNQTGIIGTQLSAPLVVALIDTSSKPVPNQTVVFKVTGSNGTLSAGGPSAPSATIAVNTDPTGKAQVLWTLGQRSGAGINTVQASSALAIGPANFTATAVTGNAAQIVVDSGNGQTGVLGQALPFPFVAAVVDSGHNRVANVPVTFTVKQGGGSFSSGTSQIVNTDSNGRAIAVLTLGLQEGFDNNVVEASFPGNIGFAAAFAASAKAPGNPANTTISGVVLDNSNNPIPGATIRLFQTNQGNNNNLPVQIGTPVQTTAKGTFLVPSAPVGFFKLMADGSTATNSISYPTLEYDIVTVAGNDNTVGMPIYLPALDTVNKLCVDATHGGTLTLPQVPGFSLTVLPGSATFPGGSKQGCVSVTPVNGDKVPMAPGFGQQPRFIVTIQPVGTTFNPPAPMTLPNVDGLAPKSVTEMYSYDHDLGMFIAVGTGTVSDDGSVIASSPGVGVLKAGWHCGGNPNSTGSCCTCPDCQTCQGSGCVADASQDGQSPPDNKCKICRGGIPTDIPLNPTETSVSVTFGMPNATVTAINDALDKLKTIGVLASVNLLQITGTVKTKECCEPEIGKGLETTGSVSGSFGSISVEGKIWPPGPIPTFEATIDVFGVASVSVKADFLGGVFLGLKGEVTGEVGRRQSGCSKNPADQAGCFFANLNTTLTPSLTAKVGGTASLTFDCVFCVKTTISADGTFNVGQLSWPLNISSVTYNASSCSGGLAGGLFQPGDGSFKISVEFKGTYVTEGGISRAINYSHDFFSCSVNTTTGVTCVSAL